jgi:hypothetical protein
LPRNDVSYIAGGDKSIKQQNWKPMKLKLAIVCIICCSSPALAQYGITNQRDAQGNIVRDSGGAYAQRGINQGPINNGPIRNAPAQPPIANANQRNGAGR